MPGLIQTEAQKCFANNGCIHHMDAISRQHIECLSRLNPKSAFYYSVIHDRIDIITDSIKNKKVDINEEGNFGLDVISCNNKVEILKLIMSMTEVNLAKDNNQAIKFACQYGHREMFEELIKHPEVNIHVDDDLPIRLARNSPNPSLVTLIENLQIGV